MHAINKISIEEYMFNPLDIVYFKFFKKNDMINFETFSNHCEFKNFYESCSSQEIWVTIFNKLCKSFVNMMSNFDRIVYEKFRDKDVSKQQEFFHKVLTKQYLDEDEKITLRQIIYKLSIENTFVIK